jgi:plasmid stabilization system protein ParE
MDRKLVWTEKASSDIEAIVRYIARRDPKAAARIGLGIYDRARSFTLSPVAPELQRRRNHQLSLALASNAVPARRASPTD